ncbi:MAG: hypothetical protein Q8934_19760 [Bacillota bacterium]|nr:hypothetical protein [Bacillota bacterium]
MNTDPQVKPKKKKKVYLYERPHRITKAEEFIFFIDYLIIDIALLYGIFKLIVWLIHAF